MYKRQPLYQAFICGLVKLVFSMRNIMSSLDNFLLLELPMSPDTDLYSIWSYSSPQTYTIRSSIDTTSHYAITKVSILSVRSAAMSYQNVIRADLQQCYTEGA